MKRARHFENLHIPHHRPGQPYEGQERRLDISFKLEEKIMGGITLDKRIMEVLNDPQNGSTDDKMSGNAKFI